MAYRRSLITRAKHFYQEERFASSFTCINHCNKDDEQRSNPGCAPEGTKIATFLQNNRYFTSGGVNRFGGSRRLLQDPRFSFVSQQFTGSMNHGLSFSRNISSTVGDGEGAVDVLADRSVEAVAAAAQVAAPAVNEVAIAAADSFLPVALSQYFIDGVHTLTGLNWWASIALATVFIRFATLPLMINQLKATSKLTLLRPRLEEIMKEMQNRDTSPSAVSEGWQRRKQLFKEHGVTTLTPLKGLLFQGPVFVSIFVAINNMVEKVPSFKEGGALWFTDLTTPDSMYILPVLTALTFLITVECNMQEGMEGNPVAAIIKNVSRVFAVATVPFTANFAKGIFCYWITSNLFSLMYGLVIKRPEVKKRLGIPIIPVTPTPAGQQKPGFSFFDAIKEYAEAQAETQRQRAISSSSSTEESPNKPAAIQQRISSSSILSQRIRTLEKEVKGRKKRKKYRKGKVSSHKITQKG